MFTFFKNLAALGAALHEFTRSIQEGNVRFRANLGLDDPPEAIETTVSEEVPALAARRVARNGAARK